MCVECCTHTHTGQLLSEHTAIESPSSVCQETLVCSWDEGIVQSVLNGGGEEVSECMHAAHSTVEAHVCLAVAGCHDVGMVMSESNCIHVRT